MTPRNQHADTAVLHTEVSAEEAYAELLASAPELWPDAPVRVVTAGPGRSELEGEVECAYLSPPRRGEVLALEFNPPLDDHAVLRRTVVTGYRHDDFPGPDLSAGTRGALWCRCVLTRPPGESVYAVTVASRRREGTVDGGWNAVYEVDALLHRPDTSRRGGWVFAVGVGR